MRFSKLTSVWWAAFTASIALAMCVLALTATISAAQSEEAQPGTQKPKGGGGAGKGGERGEQPRRGPGLIAEMTAFRTDVPETPYSIILVNPTHGSVQASVTSSTEVVGRIVYSRAEYSLLQHTPIQHLKPGEPAMFRMDVGCQPDGQVSYTWEFTDPANLEALERENSEQRTAIVKRSESRGFNTAKTAGRPFTFTIIADSHLDAPMTPAMYEQTLTNALADKPDFHIDLGDTFMTDKRGRDFKTAQPQYVAQRYYFGKLCHSAPLFMVLGNHDGEWGYARGDADAMAPWSYAQRTKYFPPPAITENADGKAMYSGCTTFAKGQGANYYEFTWGDAQFIVLDPFWFTNEKARGPGGRGGGGKDGGDRKGGDQGGKPAPDADTALTDQGWTMTLGQSQYDWLTRTLEASHSKYKFVFIHHLVGGFGRASRGGAEAAGYFEWGGKNADGSDGFAAHRPGWSMPIHQLLVKHHVSAVFHGHDHLYVREELDSVAYQCVPQPGNVNGGTRSAAEYGYRAGTVLGSPGHVRVSVSPTTAKVEFVRAALGEAPGAKPDTSTNRTVADSYEIPARPKTPK